MKKNSTSKSGIASLHNLVFVTLCLSGVLCAAGAALGASGKRTVQTKNQTTVTSATKSGASSSASKSSARVAPNSPSPASGTLSPGNPTLTYTDSGPFVTNSTHLALGKPNCTAPNSCSDYMFTVNAASVASTKRIYIQVTWPTEDNDYDTFLEDSSGNVVASNLSSAEPEVIIVPVPANGTVYHLVVVLAIGGPGDTITGSISLQDIPTAVNQAPGAPPRYINYSAGSGQANNAGEPSIGVDWNPNVASLKHDLVNTGGVAFFTSGPNEWRSNFDDCSSPAINLWENVSATTTQQFVLSDPIGFVDHYYFGQLGVSYPPPHTPGRVFTIDLVGGQGDSLGSYSDNDGGSYVPGGNGGSPAGPDHETLGGGPFHSPLPNPGAVYQNAIYYCSQNIAGEAECSRSDDGGQTFGAGVPIYNPSVCVGAIHGHVKVSPQGTVYVATSSCGTVSNNGLDGVATSTDNGITWTQHNVPNSNGNQDPSVGVGQNNVGKPSGQAANTIYLGWIDADNHAHVAHSPDEGVTWLDNTDVSSILGVQSACFPVVVAGDDNRAAFGFIGTTTPGAGAFSDPSFQGIWHLYIATTYTGGAPPDSSHSGWIVIDATPDDPVQKGEVCLGGLSCSSAQRGLLDFNDFGVDAQGRALLAYADGCVNCNNTFTGQSSQSHGTIARQSGGRRLFSAFDPVEPAPPAAPQVLSATRVSGPPAGVLVSWLKPDNGGSTIASYNIYRSLASGTETFLTTVTGENSNKYLDQAVDSSSNYFYRVTAMNSIGEGPFCREVSVIVVGGTGTSCASPYLQVAGAGSPGNVSTDPTQGELTIQSINIGEPFSSCTDNSITFHMKVNTLDPGNTGQPVLPANAEWEILFTIVDTSGTPHPIYVELDTFAPFGSPAAPAVTYGRHDPCSSACSTLDSGICTQGIGLSCAALSFTDAKDGTIEIKLKTPGAISFPAPTSPGVGSPFTWDPNSTAGKVLTNITGNTFLFVGAGAGFLETVQTTGGGPTNTYTRVGNVTGCNTAIPLAVLTANPLTGNAPLSVTFSGAGSSEPANACGTINSWTLNFGDGSAPVTQSSPTFMHTYSAPGDYPARLTVSDTVGHTSVNTAQVIVSVASVNPPALTSVRSRMTHGSAGDFEVNLPLTGARGVECRSSSSLGAGNYRLVFTFQNNLVSVGSAGMATGSASVSGTFLGPNPSLNLGANQYEVDLTNVSNAQYLSVALINAKDVTGAVGPVIGPQMGVLLGDVNADPLVDGNDVSGVQGQTRQPVTGTNFRDDMNANGLIDGNDVSFTQSHTRTSLPTPP